MRDKEEDFQYEHLIETYRSLISISVEGFKAMLLINGGAVVAFLAFLGSAAPVRPEVLPLAEKPLCWLIAALVFNVLIFVSSYATQYCLFMGARGRLGENVYRWPLGAGFICCIACVVCFSMGAFTSLDVLSAPDRNIIPIT